MNTARQRQLACYLVMIISFAMAPTFFCGCSASNWLDMIRDDALTYSLLLLSGLAFALAVRFRLRFTTQQRRLELLEEQISTLPKKEAW